MALGAVLLWRRDHEGALAESRRMMALDPNFAQGYAATGLALMYAGRAAEALEPIAMAMRLDPLYPAMVLHFLAQANFSLGKYEIAAQQLVDRIARNPGTDASRMLSGILLRPSRARGGRAGGMGGAPQSESGFLADAARARPAIQGCP